MTINEFSAGHYEQQYEYQSFLPTLINRQWVLSDPETITLLEEANRFIGELNAFSQLIPDVDFFIRMHITKEATTSSRIEGTQTNMEEALIDKRDIDPEKCNDWEEVHNYIEAVESCPLLTGCYAKPTACSYKAFEESTSNQGNSARARIGSASTSSMPRLFLRTISMYSN